MKKSEKKEILEKWSTLGFLENGLGEETNTKIALMYNHAALKLLKDARNEIRRYSEQVDTCTFPVLYRLATEYNMKMGKREVNRMINELSLFLKSTRVMTLIKELSGHTDIYIEAELLSEFSEKFAKTL